MNAPPLLIDNARVLAPGNVVDPGAVLVRDGVIEAVGPTISAPVDAERIDADGRVLMPAFVDCHTHACWAGDRLDEWDQKRAGASYLDILHAGGGIMSTVRAVRAASEDELVERLTERLAWMLREGTAAVEIKSGYGLTTEDELKMLRAVVRAGEAWPGTVTPTACIGHVIDPEFDGGAEAFVHHVIERTLPAVHDAFPGVAIDAYCETGAWSLDDCLRLFDRAAGLGHPCRVHADQFNALGLTPEAVRRGFVSVDHLEATPTDQLRALAASDTAGVMLPCSGFHVDGRYADARTFLDAGGTLAIATNCNPGSAPTSSMPFAIALAVRYLGLNPREGIDAATLGGAKVLGLTDRGVIAPGARADLILLRWHDERMLAYEFGGDPVDTVVCGGIVTKQPSGD